MSGLGYPRTGKSGKRRSVDLSRDFVLGGGGVMYYEEYSVEYAGLYYGVFQDFISAYRTCGPTTAVDTGSRHSVSYW